MNQIKVSIITPSFNRELFVAETLNSLLNQTYQNWENIIVDDGSTDRTKEVVTEFANRDNRIKLFDRNREPKGACSCRNQAVDLCDGEFLIFLDTDDLLEPFCIEQRVKVMLENTNLDFSIFPSLMFRHTPNDLALWWNIDKPIDELTRQFHQDAISQGTGIMWRKASFNRIGQWDQSLHLWQDIDLFFRAYIQDYQYGKFFDLPPDLHNRCLETSLSRNDFFALKKTQSRIKVLKNAVKLLKANGKERYLSEARYMTAEIVSGLARSSEPSIARNLVEWAFTQSVLTLKESKQLRYMIFLRTTRLGKLPYLKQYVVDVEDNFRVADCTLGTLPYKQGDSNSITSNQVLAGGDNETSNYSSY